MAILREVVPTVGLVRPPGKHGRPRRGVLLALVLAALVLGGCAGLLGRAPEEREIAIELPISRDEAVRRTLATFRIQGYRVRETLTSGTTPETEPFEHDGAEAVFRATITGSARASRVVLTGTYRRVQLGGIVRTGEREVRRSDDPIERALWDRLLNLSLVIRKPAR